MSPSMAPEKVEFARAVTPMNAWQKKKIKGQPKEPQLRIQILKKLYQAQCPPKEQTKCNNIPPHRSRPMVTCKCSPNNKLKSIWCKLHSYKVTGPAHLDRVKTANGLSPAANGCHGQSHHKLSRFGAEALAAQMSRVLTPDAD